MSESKKTVFVVGLGPGGGQFLTVQAQSALQQAEVLCGYTVYIDLVRPLYPEKECYTTGKRVRDFAGLIPEEGKRNAKHRQVMENDECHKNR